MLIEKSVNSCFRPDDSIAYRLLQTRKLRAKPNKIFHHMLTSVTIVEPSAGPCNSVSDSSITCKLYSHAIHFCGRAEAMVYTVDIFNNYHDLHIIGI